jgi:hypothetical protein
MRQPQRLRAAAVPTPRGASSLLRLSTGATRLPSAATLSQWIGRATSAWQRADARLLAVN